jgi:hypothetical protein
MSIKVWSYCLKERDHLANLYIYGDDITTGIKGIECNSVEQIYHDQVGMGLSDKLANTLTKHIVP